jgi:hypothetical protein
VIICVSRNGPLCGLKFWYQLISGKMRIVYVIGSAFAASLPQCIAFSASLSLYGWAYPIPFHLCEYAFPDDPNIMSLGNGEQNIFKFVGHVIGDEKYEWDILNDVVMYSNNSIGSV